MLTDREYSTPLPPLLDISALKTPLEISSRFKAIAEAILYDHCLRIEYQGVTTDFEVLEIEFYLLKSNIHEDPFCHAADGQKVSAQWHFHRAPRRTSAPVEAAKAPTEAGGYRGGTRKGLDLTFGSPIPSPFFPVPQSTSAICRGGILLRTIRPSNGKGGIISGPSLVVDKILSITQSRNIAELIRTKFGGCISAFPSLTTSVAQSTHEAKMYVVCCPRRPNASLPALHRSPRVGLDLSHRSVSAHPGNSRVVYFPKFYRYFIHPELLKVNGRCHTLVGVYMDHAATAATENPSEKDSGLIDHLAEVTGIKHTVVEKYLGEYVDGFHKRSLADYVGPPGKGASSNPRMFMRMLGVLARMNIVASGNP